MRFSVAFRAVLGVLTLSGLLAVQTTAALAQSNVPAAKRLPSGVLLYVSAPNLKDAYQSFQSTSYGQFLNDPEVAKFKAQFVDLMLEKQVDVENKLGIPAKELVNLISGEASVAVVRPVGQPLGWVSLIQIGSGKDTVEKLLQTARDNAEDVEIDMETEIVEGVDVTSVTVTKLDDSAAPVTFSYAFKDDHVVFANDSNLIESVLFNWTGSDSDSFSNNKFYQAVLKKCLSSATTEAALLWYADPVALIAAGLSANPNTQAYAGLIYSFPQLGLTGLKATGGAVEFATPEFDYVSRSLVYHEGAPTGIAKIFQLKPNALVTSDWVSTDSTQYTTFEWDIQGAYQAVESLWDTFTAPGNFALSTANILEQVGVNLKLKPDVIDALSGKFEFAMDQSTEETPFSGTFTVGVTSQEKGEKLINGLLPLIGSPASTTEAGSKLYSVPSGETNTHFALKEKTIFISNSESNVKAGLTSSVESPLKNSEKYKAIQKFVPSTVNFFSFSDTAKSVEDFYNQALAGDFDGLTEGQIDFTLLPPFEHVSKYFTPQGAYYTPDENGVLGVQFGLKP